MNASAELVARPSRGPLTPVLALALLCGCAIAEPREPRPGTVVRLGITRDTIVSGYEGERDANLGGAQRLKTKGVIELSLIDVDVAPLRGHAIRSAALHLRTVSQDPQLRLSVSTVATAWVEGNSDGYRPQTGAASFLWAASGERRWAFPGSDVTAVINGLGNTVWRFADATPPDPAGWQTVAVAPEVVAARVAGVSHGFAVTDDVGHEYSRSGPRFAYRIFPNRYFASRESGADSAPYLTVELGPPDLEPPSAVVFHHVDIDVDENTALGAGEALARWTTPEDSGPAGTAGFVARLSGASEFDWENASAVPQYLVPVAAQPGQEVVMYLRDLELEPGADVLLGVRAVDGAGNRGEVVVDRLRVASHQPPSLPSDPHVEAVGATTAANPTLGRAEVFVLDALDKIHPINGRMIPPHPESYTRANHLWSAARRRVRLYAARNEFVAAQLILATEAGVPLPSIQFESDDARLEADARIYRLASVSTGSGPLPDPLVPYSQGSVLPADGTTRFHAYLFELYVSHQSQAGSRPGRLVLATENSRLEIPVDLRVWNFTLPDHLSFVPQMNAYRLPDWPRALALYRLAHEHRTCLNRLPYDWRGGVEPDYLSWRRFDRRFAPLLDGSAFEALPRGSVPVEAFYLPLNENWPASIERGFSGGYWADRALSEEYRARFVAASRDAARHLQDRGWADTLFEFYLNNKVSHKRDGWDRSSAPWLFDEPFNTQDFWALRWYGKAFHEGVVTALRDAPPPRVKMVFRADVSRPQWQRDLLDGIVDVNVVGAGFSRYLRRLLDRKRRFGEMLYNYGTPNRVEESNLQAPAWCIRTWSLGGDGVVPWQTLGDAGSWQRAEATALFYPPRPGDRGPAASIRLKAFRRGQQDTEYLTLLSLALGVPRRVLGSEVLRRLGLDSTRRLDGTESAGTETFSGLEPRALWQLRTDIGQRLDRLAPEPRRRLVEFRPTLRTAPLRPDADYLATRLPPLP